jgi:hypothetical protein
MNDKDMIKKFKNWFEMYPPEFAEWDEWKDIDIANKQKYPIRHFLNEVLIPNTVWPITRAYDNAVSKIRFGFFEKHHLIDIKLSRDYHEVDTRMLHGMFSLLVDFVEIEKAWMEAICNKDYKRPWWKLNSRFRSREMGIKYLDWEITLIDTDDSSQGEAARITKDLYEWWVDERPKRDDPYDLMDEWGDMSKEERSSVTNQINHIETLRYDEDSDMLKKLIDVRQSLWT